MHTVMRNKVDNLRHPFEWWPVYCAIVIPLLIIKLLQPAFKEKCAWAAPNVPSKGNLEPEIVFLLFSFFIFPQGKMSEEQEFHFCFGTLQNAWNDGEIIFIPPLYSDSNHTNVRIVIVEQSKS